MFCAENMKKIRSKHFYFELYELKLNYELYKLRVATVLYKTRNDIGPNMLKTHFTFALQRNRKRNIFIPPRGLCKKTNGTPDGHLS